MDDLTATHRRVDALVARRQTRAHRLSHSVVAALRKHRQGSALTGSEHAKNRHQSCVRKRALGEAFVEERMGRGPEARIEAVLQVLLLDVFDAFGEPKLQHDQSAQCTA